MRKVVIVGITEFLAAVRSKAFLVGLLLLPILIGASTVLQKVAAKQVDKEARRFAVVDRTGRLFAAITKATQQRNALVSTAPFLPEEARADEDEALYALSQRVRKKELFAFVVIPQEVLGVAAHKLQYYSNHPNDEELRVWLEAVVNQELRIQRLRDAGIDPAILLSVDRHIPAEHLGLLELKDGKVAPAKAVDKVRTFAVPFVLLMLVFMIVMSTGPTLLNSVVEEKTSRISEVMLGAVSPYQLMAGKLMGNLGVSFVLALLYLGGGYALAASYGYADVVTPGIVAALVAFLGLAVILYGALFTAVGAAVTDFKDAQSLMAPVMMVVVLPFMLWPAVMRAPHSPFAVALSMFPTATPFIMLFRIALSPGPPAWQIAGALLSCAAFTALCVYAAGKIFRVGLLVQGKSATFAQMVKWIFVK